MGGDAYYEAKGKEVRNKVGEKSPTTYLKGETMSQRKNQRAYDQRQLEYNKMIAEAFPYANLELEIRRVEYEYCKQLYIKSKFNGGEVMRKYGLQGKELGDAILGELTQSMPLSVDDLYFDHDIVELDKQLEIQLVHLTFSIQQD